MKKIPTLLVRNPDDRAHVLDKVTPGCEWVLAGEGVATRKYDGKCMMLDEDGGAWWSRREVKQGKIPPPSYVPEDYDPVTGKWQGWEPVAQSPFVRFHEEALAAAGGESFSAGTYELLGPKINGNPEALVGHRLIRHANAEVIESHVRHTVEEIVGIVRGVAVLGYEGIVWHHPDGRMAKLKARDLPRGNA